MKSKPRPRAKIVKQEPLWKGPYSDDPQGGVTCSLLSKFIVCRHRFWLKTILGLKEDTGFNHSLEYGNIWHAGEEAFAKNNRIAAANKAMTMYTAGLFQRYPQQTDEAKKWWNVARVTFPHYVADLKKDAEFKKMKPVLQEEVFQVPYKLPSGRVIILRGKFDAVFRLNKEIWLKEHKSKGQIDELGLQRTVDQDLQTMLYQVALKQFMPKEKIAGAIYNVILRPLSDNRAIRQRKGRVVKGKRIGEETDEQFYKRLGQEIGKDPKRYFHRWKVSLSSTDVDNFRKECLDPWLENITNWWDSIQTDPYNPWSFVIDSKGKRDLIVCQNRHHFRTPFGVYNALYDGRRGDYFDFLTTGSKVGLVKAETLFPELEC